MAQHTIQTIFNQLEQIEKDALKLIRERNEALIQVGALKVELALARSDEREKAAQRILRFAGTDANPETLARIVLHG